MYVKSKRLRRTRRSPDDAPELTAEWAAGVDLYDGKTLVRCGRPLEVLGFFRASGPGWQTRVNVALKRYVAARQRP